jgi:hypothetical protein
LHALFYSKKKNKKAPMNKHLIGKFSSRGIEIRRKKNTVQKYFFFIPSPLFVLILDKTS